MRNDMDNNFSVNLKRLRVANKVTQKELAKALNTTLKTVSHWETGYTEPSIKQILDISDYFSVSLEELLK